MYTYHTKWVTTNTGHGHAHSMVCNHIRFKEAIVLISFQVKPVSVQPRVGPSNDLFNTSTAH